MNFDTHTFRDGQGDAVIWYEDGSLNTGAPGAKVWDDTFR